MKENSTRILITGASGQLGANIIDRLAEKNVDIIASDIRLTDYQNVYDNIELDVLDQKRLREIVDEYNVKEIYHLAAILSAMGEKIPMKAWDVNIQGLLNILEVAREANTKVFWPSSIAVFGPTTPKKLVPQKSVMEPSTVYGISKVAGELWCEYYFNKYQVDVRSVRFPGIISWKGEPGGGTTDYAVEVFHRAVRKEHFVCFLKKGTYLPMLYIDDAIGGIIQLMEAEKEDITVRTSYNMSGMSFSPEEVIKEVQKHYPNLKYSYEPDFRQQIADSWPESLKDEAARRDWGWNPKYGLEKTTKEMLSNLEKSLLNNQSLAE